MRDAQGRVSRWFGNNVDISEQTETEEKLRASEAQLRELNEDTRANGRSPGRRNATECGAFRRMSCWLPQFDGRVIAANPAWTTMLGWTGEELRDRSFLDLVHPDDLEPTIEQTRMLSDGRKVLHFENRYRRRDGHYRWLAWSAVPEVGLNPRGRARRDGAEGCRCPAREHPREPPTGPSEWKRSGSWRVASRTTSTTSCNQSRAGST